MMEKIQDRINEQSPWQHITEGNKIFEAATSKDFCTGEWRTATPVFESEKCKQTLLSLLALKHRCSRPPLSCTKVL